MSDSATTTAGTLPAAGPAPAAPARPAPLTGAPLIAGTFALSAATFMVILDTSIANVSIPAISGDLGVSSSQGARSSTGSRAGRSSRWRSSPSSASCFS